MDFKNAEFVVDQEAEESHQQLKQLEEFQLALVGGGIGETIL